MAKCDYCGATIIMGGVKEGDRTFCDPKCQGKGHLTQVARAIPDQVMRDAVLKVHLGQCPKCGGSGPVDIYPSYRVWSIVVFTSFGSRQDLCCRWCGFKSQVGGILFSGILGWWGFPFGVVMTPVQIFRNLSAMLNVPSSSSPSPKLEEMLRLEFAARGIV